MLSQKHADRTLEAVRAVSETAISESRENADTALTTIFNIFAVVSFLFVVAGGLFGWFFYRSRKDLHKELTEYVKEAKKRIEQEEQGFVKDLADRSKDVLELAGKSQGLREAVQYMVQESDPQQRRSLWPFAMSAAKPVEELAAKLNDERTLGWINTQKALAHYMVDDFDAAYECQKQACATNPMEWPDRLYNLACITARQYKENTTNKDKLEETLGTLKKMSTAPREMLDAAMLQLAKAATDDDLKDILVLQEAADVRETVQEAVNLIKQPPTPPATS